MAADHAQLQETAKRHLMMHFTRQSAYHTEDVPVISHGEGCWLYDTKGKKYFDGLSGLFCTQIGYSFGAPLLSTTRWRRRSTSAPWPACS